MPTDDQIRQLCSRVLTTSGAEFESTISDLQSAIRQRLEGISNRAVATMLRVPRSAAASAEGESKAQVVPINDREELDEVS